MDPNRHHEFNKDERSRAMYLREMHNVISHTQYVPQDSRAISNKKPCGCTGHSDNIMCNGCRTSTAEVNWSNEQPQQRIDYRNTTDERSALRQSPMYMHPNVNNRPGGYWPQNNSVFGEESLIAPKHNPAAPPPHMERGLAPGKSEITYNYKQAPPPQPPPPLQQARAPPQAPPRGASALGTYPKERSYDDKYSAKHEATKIGYPTASYNMSSHNAHHLDLLRGSGKSDQHIINPSNLLAAKEQHPSPNYARKCPQIFPPEEQNSAHINLYMSTPQFSSDKFTSMHTQHQHQQQLQQPKIARNSPQQDCRGLSSSTPHVNLMTDSSKLRESPMQLHSSLSSYAPQNKYHQMSEPMLQQPAPYASANLRNVSYYPQGSAKAHLPEMSPVIVKQTHTHYQYSKSPLPAPASHLAPAKVVLPTREVEYIKKEDELYDSHGVPARNLYVNPYNTPPSTADSCCKKPSSPYTVSPNYQQKYGKLVQETVTTNDRSMLNQTRESTLRSQPYFYEPSRSYEGNTLSAPSPVAGKAAPPSPSLLTSQQPQMHHMDYAMQHHYAQSAYNQQQTTSNALKQHNEIPSHHSEVYERQMVQQQQQQQTSKLPHKMQQAKMPPLPQIPPAPPLTSTKPSAALKKSQAAKPNYKELINQVYAMRSTTSEDELNRQIIKKTLNIDAQAMRPANVPPMGGDKNQTSPHHGMNNSVSPAGLVNLPTSYGRDPYRPDLVVGTSQHHLPKAAAAAEAPDLRRTIKQEEKSSSSSPLDLSMRTIKTKADSTEYKYRRLPSSSQNVDFKNAMPSLPRVDLTPNFAAHTDRNVITKALIRPEERLYSSTSAYPSTESLERRIYASPDVMRTTPTLPKLEPHPVKRLSDPSISTLSNSPYDAKPPPVGARPDAKIASHLVIKSSNKPPPIIMCDIEACQVRPSVVESNPYAAIKLKQEPSSPQVTDRNIRVVEQLPPDTSIMVLPKASGPSPTHAIVQPTAPPRAPVQSAYSLACERNPNFLGRKRHLQEYSTAKYSDIYSEPPAKQRYEEPTPVPVTVPVAISIPPPPPQPTPEYVRPTEVPVIAVNERVAEMERMKAVEKMPPADFALNNVEPLTKVKEEPLTPTSDVQPPLPTMPPTIKTETPTSIIAARIRTKAELKGFTFNPPMVMESYASKDSVQIKQEPQPQISSSETLSMPEVAEEFSQSSLLDFRWSNTCNSFVEQLLTSSVTLYTKECEVSEEEVPEMQRKEESIDFSIGENNISNLESTESTFRKTEANDSQYTIRSFSQDPMLLLQKKSNKMDREKLRLQQQRRIAARLQSESSSESDDELDKRKSERLKKHLKKATSRLNILTKKNRYSDCGSDSSTDTEDNAPACSRKGGAPPSSAVLGGKEELANRKEEHEQQIAGESSKETAAVNDAKTDDDANSQDASTCEKPPSKELSECPVNDIENESQESSGKNMPSTDNDSKLEKPAPKRKLHSKVDLNTMTRSKRKRELELQLANSIVLRNDKVIRNSTDKIKRKYVRKYNNSPQNSPCAELLEPEEQDVVSMSTRLRSKIEKDTNSEAGKKLVPKKTQKNAKVKEDTVEAEPQVDLQREVYLFKRSLKVPPSLISGDHRSNHKLAAEEPKVINETKSNRSSKSHKGANAQADTKAPAQAEQPRSIIDVLHSRVLSNTQLRTKPKVAKSTSNVASSLHMHSETSQNTETNSVSELMSMPPLNKDEAAEAMDGKKRHFSIFDTKVLQTKTRTESKLREIFVGDDRPASAPPEMIQALDGTEIMTYEQKYEQFLQQMNYVIDEDKLRRFGRATTSITGNSVGGIPKIKQEEDTESTSAIDPDEKLEHREQILMSGTPTNFRRRRPAKYLRRKGSSGFDYIRKKKKPQPLNSSATLTSAAQPATATVKTERLDEEYELKVKTEADVCREIQKWVLNKGVGQSTMHKAARLGYIDVIVYCLERLGMNPDQKDNAGYTPLHEACTNGWLEIARVLLQCGANHSEAAHSGIRPLHEASENDHVEIVRLLLSYGADPLLATYSGQTPLMLASSAAMREILNNHLSDVQYNSTDRKPWRFNGPWEIFDPSECGYDTLGGAPNFTCDMSRALRKSSVSSLITNKKQFNQFGETCSKTVMEKCAVVLENIDRFNSVRIQNDSKPEFLVENSDSDGEIFEFEEADVLLPPLYLLKDEGTDKWVLLSDLCNLLKVKSKDTLLNKIYPASSLSNNNTAQKSIVRELKMSDFLEKATCLQLLSAGEKINICSSKVVLIKYNESVRNLLGVKTLLMKF